MICLKPYHKDGQEFGCGQCASCRVNRRRLWTSRIILELQAHAESCFVTLTYDEEHYPSDGSVSKRDVQLFLKRLRKNYNKPVRYYIVGEYGELTYRAHYHCLLFGISDADFIARCWSKGHVHVGTITLQSAAYTVSYLQKGFNKEGPLPGLLPEFSIMSRKPGLGALSLQPFIDLQESKNGSSEIVRTGDVVREYRVDGKLLPLGKYLRSRLRCAAGFEELGEPVQSKTMRFIEKKIRYEQCGNTVEFLKKESSKRKHAGHVSRVRHSIIRSKL